MPEQPRVDVHCHVVGNGKELSNIDDEVFLDMSDNQHWFTWMLSHMIENNLVNMGAVPSESGITSDNYLDLVAKLFIESKQIDRIVLLALDAVFENGAIDPVKTDLWVSNRYLSRRVGALNKTLKAKGSSKRFYYGASVSPNRLQPDWEAELDTVLGDSNAVLMKWIPSTQHIHVDQVSKEFYRRLAQAGMPLLCHVGPEYSFPEGMNRGELDDVLALRWPLDCKVKVIAAHCAAPVFTFKDANRMNELATLMKDFNSEGDVRLWADTSALSLSTRLSIIGEILDTFSADWLVHGSDFPVPIDGLPHLPVVTHGVTPAEYIDIVRTKNPFDRDVKIKRAHGFADSILTNATKILRLPEGGNS